MDCRFGAHAQALHRLPRFETGQYSAGRARPRPHFRSGIGLRLLQEETTRQRVTLSLFFFFFFFSKSVIHSLIHLILVIIVL